MLERFLIPLSPYILLAAVCIAALILLASLEKEIRRLKSRLSRPREAGSPSSAEFQRQLDGLSARLRDAEERAAILPVPVSIKPSLNLNKRTQVIRMSRRGEAPQTIAASLSLPRREVELLLKVYALTLTNPNDTIA
jgi:hypothetical protein